MRGFFLGSLALIALYTAINQTENAGAVLTTSQTLLQRAISAEVGAVPNRAGAVAPETSGPPGNPVVNPTFAPFANNQPKTA